MKYCARCLYPENAKPTIIFDDEGVCSGCRYHESRSHQDVDWEERWQMLEEIASDAKKMAKERHNAHDCIVPVSGGKDSHYQVWLLKEKLGLNPLLVTFNHAFNTAAGIRNLRNLVTKSGCDLVRYTAGITQVRKLSRLMLEKVGDITWHYHAGIRTFPFQVACEKNIPLIVWGEHGFAELTGIVTLHDFVEHTRWTRKEHDMRGLEPEDLIGQGGVTEQDIAPYIYPTDDALEQTEVRGIYLSNFINWSNLANTRHMIETWNFGTITYERQRTFSLFSKIEDHANDVHDYLKYLKFGYGRATDDASMEIRHGRMSREEGIDMVKRYDAQEPHSLDFYCKFLGISKTQFYELLDNQRDQQIWSQSPNGVWETRDSVWQHPISNREEQARVEQSLDRSLSLKNNALFYSTASPPETTGEKELDHESVEFIAM